MRVLLFLCFKPKRLQPVPGATDISDLVYSLEARASREAAALAETRVCGSHLFLQMRGSPGSPSLLFPRLLGFLSAAGS